MQIRLMALADRLRASLFVLPTVCVIAAVALGVIGLQVDRSLGDTANNLPLGVASTVDSARAVLSTIAGATITVAGIAFSIALLVIQLASSQYSPRVVHGLFRDPFNKRVMGLVVGTFTYCLVVLRSVRSALEDGGDPVVPNVSVAVAVLLGLASVLSIVAFINHNAHTMDISEILERVTADSVRRLDETWPNADNDTAGGDDTVKGDNTVKGDDATEDEPVGLGPLDLHRSTIAAASRGWVQYIDHERLLDVLPPGAILQLDVGIGGYAIAGAPLATVWLDGDPGEELCEGVLSGVGLGRTRTMAQDPAYGVRQLVDIALRALSPGVNDPTTAHDALVHLGAILAESYQRCPPPKRHTGPDGRVLLDPHAQDHRSLTNLAFTELRRAARADPAVIEALFAVVGALAQVTSARPHPVIDELCDQADAALEEALDTNPSERDRQRLRAAHERLRGRLVAGAR